MGLADDLLHGAGAFSDAEFEQMDADRASFEKDNPWAALFSNLNPRNLIKRVSAKVEDAPSALRRPPLRKSTREAIDRSATRVGGKIRDPNTGELVDDADAVYGHVYGRENRRILREAKEKGMPQKELNDWVNSHPEWFQRESAVGNASHRFEKPGND